MLVYVDSSALVKLVVREDESAALADAVRGHVMTSSALLRTELRRAVARRDDRAASDRAELLVARVKLLQVDDGIWDAAGRLRPPRLRSLDAVHVACALALGPRLDVLIAYDTLMVEAARIHGLTVLSPGQVP